MAKTIVEIDFEFSGDRADFDETFMPFAQTIAEVDGLVWKVWLWNDESRRGGGVYLFDDESSAMAYLEGPIVGQLKAHEKVSDPSVHMFDVCETQTEITRGPVEAMVS